MHVIDVRGDGRFFGHGPLRRRARFDRVELAKQAGITWVEQIRLLAPPPLPDDPAVLKQMILELLDELKKSQHECEGLQQRLDQLIRRLYGPKAERFDPNQPWLLPELA